MHKKLVLSVAFFCMASCCARATWAQAPGEPGYPGDPLGANPPVRQTIGMMDTLVSMETEADCRACHSSGVPDRHHALVFNSEPIPEGSIVPVPDANHDGVPDTVYTCLNCHIQHGVTERNCIVCHTSNAHHNTPKAKAGDCVSCHGNVVNNWDDGHYIPTYDPSLVTPSVFGGSGLPLNNRGNGAGACIYCHNDDGRFAGDEPGTPDPRPDERIILNNSDLHHGEGFTDCMSCHTAHGVAIRVCESCHGVESLHGIQADSNGDGIIRVGGELAGYGHVGRDAGPGDSDCWGCHGFAVTASTNASRIGLVTPTLYNVDVNSITAGTDTAVVLRGVGFTNSFRDANYQSVVRLTANNGVSVTLEPDAVGEETLAVTIPGNLAPGNYRIQAVKGGAASNPAVISIIPKVTITDVTADGLVTINGSGFGGYTEGSGTSVVSPLGFSSSGYQQAMATPATIISWTDTQIVADFGDVSPDQVLVKSIFGVATADVPEASNTETPSEPQLQTEPEPQSGKGGSFSFRGGLDFNRER